MGNNFGLDAFGLEIIEYPSPENSQPYLKNKVFKKKIEKI